MDFPCQESDAVESLTPGVFDLSGEPAVVINGLPPIPSGTVGTLVPSPTTTKPEIHWPEGFGQWFEGREVRKIFEGQYYSGKVIEFDKEVGWFKVKYEDGDLEDLEWHELEEILQPLDVTIPLRMLATKIVKRKQRSVQKLAKSVGRTRYQGTKYGEEKHQNLKIHERFPVCQGSMEKFLAPGERGALEQLI